MKRIATIGYEGVSLDDFITSLIEAGIRQVIDVREMPLSRKRGFSKTALAANLEANDIAYLHLRGLGDPKEGRLAARAGDYAAFQKIFRKHMMSAVARRDLEWAISAAKAVPSVLMCYEREPAGCHRAIVAEAMAKSSGLCVKNLFVGADDKMAQAA